MVTYYTNHSEKCKLRIGGGQFVDDGDLNVKSTDIIVTSLEGHGQVQTGSRSDLWRLTTELAHGEVDRHGIHTIGHHKLHIDFGTGDVGVVVGNVIEEDGEVAGALALSIGAGSPFGGTENVTIGLDVVGDVDRTGNHGTQRDIIDFDGGLETSVTRLGGPDGVRRRSVDLISMERRSGGVGTGLLSLSNEAEVDVVEAFLDEVDGTCVHPATSVFEEQSGTHVRVVLLDGKPFKELTGRGRGDGVGVGGSSTSGHRKFPKQMSEEVFLALGKKIHGDVALDTLVAITETDDGAFVVDGFRLEQVLGRTKSFGTKIHSENLGRRGWGNTPRTFLTETNNSTGTNSTNTHRIFSLMKLVIESIELIGDFEIDHKATIRIDHLWYGDDRNWSHETGLP